MYYGFLPEILFQRHPSRKYHNDGFYQNFWNGRRCFRPEFRIFFDVGFDQKKCDWQLLSRGIRPEKDFFGLRWILPETNKKMFFFQRPLIQKKNGCRILPESIFLYYSSRKKNILVGSIRTYSGWKQLLVCIMVFFQKYSPRDILHSVLLGWRQITEISYEF